MSPLAKAGDRVPPALPTITSRPRLLDVRFRGDMTVDNWPQEDDYVPMVALMILSGSLTGSPRLILSTFSMPSITVPQTVY